MVDARPLAPLAINLVGAAIAVAVGLRLRARRPDGDAGRAIDRFAAWWIALGAYILLGQSFVIAGGLGIGSPAVAALLSYTGVAAFVVAIWGLVSYLTYLYSGRGGLLRPLTILYGLQFVLSMAYVASLSPNGITLTEWGGAPTYANEPHPLGSLLFAALFLLPPFIGALLIAAVAFRVKERTPRYRAAAVSIGLFIWFGTALVLNGVTAAGGKLNALTAVGGPFLGLLCMLLIVSAYMPPAGLRARGVDPFGGQAPEPPRREGSKERRSAFAERARDLV